MSKASGLPDWLELLQLVGEPCWGSGGRATVDQLVAAQVSLLVEARLKA